MKILDGKHLVYYINQNSDRFRSGVFEFGSQCLVFIADIQTIGPDGRPHAFEPIADFEQYMIRMRGNEELLHRDCLLLLEAWEAAYRAKTELSRSLVSDEAEYLRRF